MKKEIFIGFLILLLPFMSKADDIIDIKTLKSELSHSSGEKKIDVLIKLSEKYRVISYLDCKNYGKDAIELASKIHDYSKAGLASKSLGVSCYLSGDFAQALHFFQKGANFYKKADNKQGVANCLNNMGLIYESWSNYPKALNFYLQSFDYEKKMEHLDGMAVSLINIGNIYLLTKQYNKALKSYLESLNFFTDLKNKEGMGDAYNSIAILYYQMKDYKKVREFLEKAKIIFTSGNQKRKLSKVLNNLGDLYYEHLHDFKKARLFYEEALNIKKELNSKIGIALVECNLGSLYGQLGDKTTAIKYLENSLKIYKSLKDISGQSMVFYNMGNLYFDQRKYKKAEYYFTSALKLAKKADYKIFVNKIYDKLTIIYAATGNFNQFEKYFDMYKTYKDSVIQQLEKNKIKEIEAEYKVNDLNKNAMILKKESLHSKNIIKKYQLFSFILIGILIVLLVIIFNYIKIQKQKKQYKN